MIPREREREAPTTSFLERRGGTTEPGKPASRDCFNIKLVRGMDMAKKVETANLSTRPQIMDAEVWVVGDMPLIVHAWSEKARREMLSKQLKAVKGSGREAKDPVADFRASLYEMGDGAYGFPVTGFKNALLSAAHKDRGIPRSEAMKAIFMQADMVRVRPALAGAICDMPMVRIYGSEPEMREDMVRVGSGLNKTANLAYRGQFTTWACRLKIRFNSSIITLEQLQFLVETAGMSIGVGEWRNEKSGMFGAFHLASAEEAKAWSDYAAGIGPLPGEAEMRMAAE